MSWDLLLDVLLDVLMDSLKTLPFLFGVYLLIEILEHYAQEKTINAIHRAGPLGPVLGGLLGVVPQCGFSAATSNLYACGLISRGTLIAVFLSTSDEMLPILIAQSAPLPLILKVLAYKLVSGIVVGILIDLVSGKLLHGELHRNIEDMCEQEDCHCEDSVLKSALRHTVKIFIFLFVITFVVSLVIEWIGTDTVAGFILNRPVLGELLAGVIGLIPSCAGSVVITGLYLQGGMTIGAMLSGLLVSSGVGLLVLFRMNHNLKDSLLCLVLTFVTGVGFGLLANVFPIF